MINEQVHSAAAAGTLTIGRDLTVNRLGYGPCGLRVPAFGDLPLIKAQHLQRAARNRPRREPHRHS
jgi:hypothetical protein